jgi:hypothetical protein
MARILAEHYKKANPKNKIVALDLQGRFRDIKTEDFDTINPDKYARFHKNSNLLVYSNTLFIMDDYHTEVEERTPEWLQRLLNLRNEHGIDMIFITHSPTLIRKKLSFYATHLYLFYTMGTEKDFKDKLPDYEMTINARRIINQYVKKYGRGEYPKFPFVIVNYEDNKIQTINM